MIPSRPNGRREPWDAGVGIGPGGQVGGQHRDVGAGLVEPGAEARSSDAVRLAPRAAGVAHRSSPRAGHGAAKRSRPGGSCSVRAGLDVEIDTFARARAENMKSARLRGQPPRRLGEGDDAGALDVVQPVDSRRSTCRPSSLGAAELPRAPALHAAHLEHVAKVGGELEGERQHHLVEPVVGAAAAARTAGRRTGSRLRSTWMTPRGVAFPPTGGRARLAPWKVKTDLSRDRPKLRREGRRSPISRRKRDRKPRVVAEQAVGAADDIAPGVGDQEGVAVLDRQQLAQRRREARLVGVQGRARQDRPWAEASGDLGERSRLCSGLRRASGASSGAKGGAPGGRRRDRDSPGPWRWPRTAGRSGGGSPAGRGRRARAHGRDRLVLAVRPDSR